MQTVSCKTFLLLELRILLGMKVFEFVDEMDFPI
jgi:hypothetical protein